MKALFALLLRVCRRHATPAERADMAATFDGVVRDSGGRGTMARWHTALGECLDLVTSAWAGDPLAAGSRALVFRPGAGGVFPSIQDWRNAARRATAHRGYAATVIVVLALGIAVNTVVFSVADATLFRGLPYPNGPRVVEVFNENVQQQFWFPGLVPATFAEWRSQRDVFERLEGFNYGDFVLTGGAEPLDVGGAYVTPGLLDLLGVHPAVGRLFRNDEAEPGRDHVAIISYGLWRRLGGSSELSSLSLVLNDQPFAVVGVMPAHFRFPAAQQEVWVPTPVQQPGHARLQAIALLRPGLTKAAAQARLDILAKGLDTARPQASGWALRLMPMRGLTMNGSTTRALQVLTGAVLLVLLIACANVANLFFAQALGRSRELVIRAALGATRGRLVRELLAESLLLGMCGGAIGLALAWWGVSLALSLAPTQVTLFSPNEIRIDARILSFTIVMTVATGILFGVLPAWRASRATAADALRARSGEAGVAHARIRGVLVASEVALSVVLLVGASLLIRSFTRLEGQDPGFHPHGLLTVTLDIPTDRYPSLARRTYLRTLQRAIGAVPGVQGVAVADGVPTSGGAIHFGRLQAEDAPATNGTDLVPDATVSPEYFATLEIPIRRGRTFVDGELPASAIVSESFARRLWPGADPIGKRFRIDEASDWRTVVGVAGEVHQGREMERKTAIEMYSPLFDRMAPAAAVAAPAPARTARDFVEVMLVLRADRLLDLVDAVKRTIWQVDSTQAVYQVALVDHLLARSLTQDRFATTLMGTFAALALLLAAAGLYAVLAQLVAQRRQEIGIRLALGADPSGVVRLVVSRGLTLTAVGVGVGLLAAWPAARALASQLYDVRPHDPLSFTIVPLLLAGVALSASWLPARRALAVDPATALRNE